MPMAGKYEKRKQTLPSALTDQSTQDGYVYDGGGQVERARSAAADYPAYESPYASRISGALKTVTERPEFSYDPASDPLWQAYRKQYAREGSRATEDTLGRYAAMTGGVPSTAAVTAAQQANDYYNAKLADKVPELYKLAYDMYADAEARRLKALEALRSARGDELARWDAQRQSDYKRAQDARADALALAKLGAANGDYTGLAALGIDTTRAAGTRWAYGPDGSVYEISSARGQGFLDSAQPGQSMTGGDGSVWTKQADGSVVITRGDQTWTLAAPAAPVRTYGGGGGKKKEKDEDEEKDAGGDYPIDRDSVLALGYGPIGDDRLAALVDAGEVEQYFQGGMWRFRRRGDGKGYDTPLFTGAMNARAARLGL